MSYSEKYMQHFASPQNVGEVANPDATAEVQHQGGGCFDRIRMTVRLNGDTIEDVQFKARACSGTLAAASAATVWAKGKTVAEARQVDADTLDAELGGVPEKKRHSVELAAEAVREVLSKL